MLATHQRCSSSGAPDCLLNQLASTAGDGLADTDCCAHCQASVAALEQAALAVGEHLSGEAAANPFEAEEACRRIAEQIALPDTARGDVEEGPEANGRLPAETIRHYRLLEPLGRGGMGAVYKALHTKLNKVVALKVLPAEHMAQAAAVSRFEREKRAIGQLDHPNIVVAHDAGEADNVHYLAMELVDGFDLSVLVRRHGPLRVADACELIRQAALGLQYVHEHGMVHRDIKPSNLMLDRACHREANRQHATVKILDLGLALLGAHGAHGRSEITGELTAAGQLMGTLDYMAPEQCDDSHKVDIRADIYSLGATLYALLTGEAPFAGPKYGTPIKKLKALATDPAPPISQRRPGLPAGLRKLVDRMLDKDPARRPATPAEVARALKPLASGHNITALFDDKVGKSAARSATADTASRPGARILVGGRNRTVSVRTAVAGSVVALAVLAFLAPYLKRADADAPANREVTSEELPSASSASAGLGVADSIPRDPVGDDDEVKEEVGQDEDETLEGLIPHPRRLPGVGRRWQVYTRSVARTGKLSASPDGQLIAVTSETHLRIYEVTTSRLQAIIPLHGGVVRRGSHAFWRADSQWVAVALGRQGGKAESAELWHMDGSKGPTLPEFVPLAWSPDGRLLAGATPGRAEAMLKVYQFDGTRVRVAFSVDTMPVNYDPRPFQCAFSPDGQWLAVVDRQKKEAHLWDVRGRRGPTMTPHDGGTVGVAWHPRGESLATFGARAVRIQRFDASQPRVLRSELAVRDVVWRPDGTGLAAVVGDGTSQDVWYWPLEGTPSHAVASRIGPKEITLHWNVAGTRLAALHTIWPHGGRGFFRLFKFEQHQSVELPLERPTDAIGLSWSRDGRSMFLTHASGDPVRLRDAGGQPIGPFIEAPPVVDDVAISPDSRHFASGDSHGMVRRWSIDGQLQWVRKEHTGPVADVDWHPTDGCMASIGAGGQVIVWDQAGESHVAWRREIGTKLPSQTSAVAFDPADGRRIGIADTGGVRMLLWQTRQLEREVPGDYTSVAWSPDGEHFVANSLGAPTFSIYRRDGTVRAVAKRTMRGGLKIAWHPDSSGLLACGADGLQSFDIDGRAGQQYRAKADYVTSRVWSPDGAQIVATSSYGMRYWQADGQAAEPLEKPTARMHAVDFSRDGRWIVAGGAGQISIWDANTRRLKRILVPMNDGQAAIFTADGEFLHATPAAEKELAYVVPRPQGGVETLSPLQFRRRGD